MAKVQRKNLKAVADLGQLRVEKYGVEALIRLVDFSLVLLDAVRKTLTDGKFKAREVFNFTESLRMLPSVIRSSGQAKYELGDLSDSEIEAIRTHFNDKFKLDDSVNEQMIESAIEIALNFYKSLR